MSKISKIAIVVLTMATVSLVAVALIQQVFWSQKLQEAYSSVNGWANNAFVTGVCHNRRIGCTAKIQIDRGDGKTENYIVLNGDVYGYDGRGNLRRMSLSAGFCSGYKWPDTGTSHTEGATCTVLEAHPGQ